MKFVKWFEEIGAQDVGLVGGKNASLGEMIRNLANKGISVPSGFAITVQGYKDMIEQAGIGPRIEDALVGLDTRNMRNLAARGEKIRNLMYFLNVFFVKVFDRVENLSAALESRIPHLA